MCSTWNSEHITSKTGEIGKLRTVTSPPGKRVASVKVFLRKLKILLKFIMGSWHVLLETRGKVHLLRWRIMSLQSWGPRSWCWQWTEHPVIVTVVAGLQPNFCRVNVILERCVVTAITNKPFVWKILYTIGHCEIGWIHWARVGYVKWVLCQLNIGVVLMVNGKSQMYL